MFTYKKRRKMEKLTNFDLMTEKFLGFKSQDLTTHLILQKCAYYKERKEILNGLLLTTSNLETENWLEEVSIYFTSFSGISLTKVETEELRWKKSGDLLKDLLAEPISSQEEMYEFAIKMFVARPLGDTTATAFFIYEIFAQKDSAGLEVSNVVLKFYEANERYSDLLFWAFKFLCDATKGNLRNRCLLYLTEKLRLIKADEVLLSLYWYYSYLGYEEIVNIVFEALLKNEVAEEYFRLSSFKLFHWPDLPLESIKNQYEALVSIQLETHPNSKLKFSEILFKKKFHTLIPLCLYAKSNGNLELESVILWRAIRKDEFGNLFDRLEEVNGYPINQRTRINFLFEKTPWVRESLLICDRCVLGQELTEGNIQRCKDLFTLNPQNNTTLKGLLGIHKYNSDNEVLEMLKHSISRKIGNSSLSDLSLTALRLRSSEGLKIISGRMSELSYKNTKPELILNIITKVYEKAVAKKNRKEEQILFTLEALYFYYHFTEKIRRDDVAYKSMRANCIKLKKSRVDPPVFKNTAQQNVITAKSMFSNNSYRKLISWFYSEKNLSVEVLEIVLKACLKEGLGIPILEVYRELVNKNASYARIYNIEVEPFIRFANIKSKHKIIQSSGNFVSRVWEIPAILENPVDRSALFLSNFAK